MQSAYLQFKHPNILRTSDEPPKVHPKYVKCWGVWIANTPIAFLFADALLFLLLQATSPMRQWLAEKMDIGKERNMWTVYLMVSGKLYFAGCTLINYATSIVSHITMGIRYCLLSIFISFSVAMLLYRNAILPNDTGHGLIINLAHILLIFHSIGKW